MMEGHRVKVRCSDEIIEGVLQLLDERGAFVHKCYGYDDEKVFIPMYRIEKIIDLGRAP